MENKKEFFDQEGNKLVIEEIMTFKIDSLGKTFVAYTINDDQVSSEIDVNLIEVLDIESDIPQIKKIDAEDENLVLEVFNNLLRESN